MALIALNATKTTLIDGSDLADAVCDPKVVDLVSKSLAYGASLAASGKDHSLDAA